MAIDEAPPGSPPPDRAWPPHPAAASQAGRAVALFLTGFGTFLTLYAPQPLLPLFRQLFHASELLVSLTVTASVLAVAMAAPLVGLLADALGRKRVIVAAMIGQALPTFLAATASGLPGLILWRFLQGLFIPGIIAVAMAYISEESPAHAVASTMATYVAGNVVGGFSGRFISGWVAFRWGWRAAFVLLGAAALLSALVTWWLLPGSTRFIRQRTAFASLLAFREHLHNPQLLATYAVGFNVLFFQVASFTYVNFYLADEPFGLSPAALSSIFAVYLIGAAVTPAAGRIIDRIGYRRAVVGAICLAGAGTLLTLVHALPVVIAGLTLSCTGVFACQSAAASHVGEAAGHARSSAAGLYVSLYYLGGGVGSVAPGLLWNRFGWIGCVGLILAVQAVTAVIAYTLWKDRPRFAAARP
jgi:YNFM family putative membrane transporter